MSNKVELKGHIIRIGKTQEFASGFKKREIVIECGDDKYENPIPVEAVKDKCENLDKFKPGEVVEIAGYLSGNYWQSGDRYFLSIRLAFVKHVEGAETVDDEPEYSTEDPPPDDEPEEGLPF